jgi:hypothetical protein
MSDPGRLKDLSDVLELVKVLALPVDFASQLDAPVRDKYQELWQRARRRFVLLWRNKWLTTDAKSVDDMIGMPRSAVDELDQMRKDGVVLDNDGGTSDDYAYLVTTDPGVAKKYGFVDESEYWDVDEEAKDSAENSPPTI